MIRLDLFKGGRKQAATFSYDDGTLHDERLIEIFNRYGIKATFNLNSARIGTEGCVKELSLYEGHEIACHGVEHASLGVLPVQNIYHEIFADRLALERLAKRPVRGLAYANGSYTAEAIEALKASGIVYARTTVRTERFELPENFLCWHPTCHHKDAPRLAERFMEKIVPTDYYKGKVFYVYGHSYEFANDNNWDMIESVCKTIGGDDRIWYATNIEIYEYMEAARRLVFTADNKIVYNPSAMTVWFSSDNRPYEIGSGETLFID